MCYHHELQRASMVLQFNMVLTVDGEGVRVTGKVSETDRSAVNTDRRLRLPMSPPPLSRLVRGYRIGYPEPICDCSRSVSAGGSSLERQI